MAEERTPDEGCTPEKCEGCPSAGNCSGPTKPEDLIEDQNRFSSINHVIGVISGKGGVGKSYVTGALAAALRKEGHSVGILDADITGPSIQKMFGITGGCAGDSNGIYPRTTNSGIKVISINMLLEDEDSPVIWRGPILAGVVKQFWTDVIWGELDYLLVDLPPGTGDVPLTVFQSIPLDGVVIVTSPQSLVSMIVKKAYHMAEQMNIPVLGIVENYSYFTCPDCGKKISVFGESSVDELAAELKVPVLGKLPIVPEKASLADKGAFDSIEIEELSEAVKVISQLK